MPSFPIMAIDPLEITHRMGEDGEGRMWTACGLRAEGMACILAFKPDCPKCIEVLDNVHQYDGDGGADG